jgi:hypothetical protein
VAPFGSALHHRVMPRPVVLLVLLAACSDAALLRDDSGSWRLVARVTDAAGLATALATATPPLAVVGIDGEAPLVPTSPPAPRVLITGAPVAAMPAGVDAVVVGETGAAVAVDCAVLACHDLALPGRILVGPRVLTAANLAAGGERRVAPGDLAAATLRRQYGDLFAPQPTAGERHRLAFVQAPGAWHDRVLAEVEAAATAAPLLQLHSRAQGHHELALAGLVESAAANGARVVLVSADDWSWLAAATEKARAAKVVVIAIDGTGAAAGATCIAGADQEAIGRALGETLARLSPSGSAVITVCGEPELPRNVLRFGGFAKALGLRQP